MRLFLMICFLFLVTACQNDQQESLSQQESNPKIVEVKNSEPQNQASKSNRELAQHLSKIADRVPNVSGATSVVAGNYIVVAIDVDKDLDRSRVGSIKYQVAEALYEDPYGKNAIVVADADAGERIRHIAEKVRQGHPVKGFNEELAGIVGRYMPESSIPHQNNQPKEPDQNKQSTDSENEQNLEEIENNQSKGQKEKTSGKE
ncbi:hypothetical protein N781_12960 [Pontibacillus halophilus JSM 076056 = DSM 19796]|uniref:YhcN/YlaJ family sporulation lipoprotein n=1 Tax=Pontibacillus halophilus JSM 076056 = DSM 19796 TaxID=1385510 RepID=A0A0A5GMT3_9BACI|nr:YhcN/YlaJ family sporulation lipoprotein [Pontibacillus halophilus]KGX93309.1 hypothetical protein N781_12960 [Pontibacillus halophilus JSM 076056 = DSM 19796]